MVGVAAAPEPPPPERLMNGIVVPEYEPWLVMVMV